MSEREPATEIFPGSRDQEALLRGATIGLDAVAAQARELRMQARRSGADGVTAFDIHDLIDAVIDEAWSHDRDPDYLRLRRDLLTERLIVGMDARMNWDALVRGVRSPSLPYSGWMEFPRGAMPAFRYYRRTGLPETDALAREGTVQALLSAAFTHDPEVGARTVTFDELIAAGLPSVEPAYDWFDNF